MIRAFSFHALRTKLHLEEGGMTMKKRMMSTVMLGALLASMLAFAAPAAAGLSWVSGELGGTTDWLADVRFRNFNSTISDYEMMVNASPTRTAGQNQENGQVPGPYAFADWAQNNDFWITYNPSANSVSLRLVGSGQRQLGTPGGYDVTISRAPDAVTAGPLNYISFQLWDRGNFPTFPNGLTISSLDGTNLGTFTILSAGIGSWSILDPGGAILNNGFILQGSFEVDLTKLAEGREGDKIIFAMGNNPNVVPIPGAVWLLGSGVAAFVGLRRRGHK
jgi:hypothetical protein